MAARGSVDQYEHSTPRQGFVLPDLFVVGRTHMNQMSRSRFRPGRRLTLFVLGCAALLVPIWIVRYPPLIGYPNHLASSFVLAHIDDARFAFSEVYRADWALSPYVATNAILVALQRRMPVELAGRTYLTICLLALPLSVWFFVRQVRADYDLPVLWAFVLSYDVFFLIGLMGYYLSIADAL